MVWNLCAANPLIGALCSLFIHTQTPVAINTLPPQPPTQVSQMVQPTYTPDEHHILAATIWGEARGQGDIGMEAVADVIMNRVKLARAGEFGIGVTGVALHHEQFSCWNNNDPNDSCLSDKHLDGLDPATPDGRAWQSAKLIADRVLSGACADITHGATYYHTKAVHPYWDANVTLVATIGEHEFYKA